MPSISYHSKPPLLQTYTLPSGPTAAPLGPPPVVATRSTVPSGLTVASVPLLISTTSTRPSFSQIGPSGNCRPSPISFISFPIRAPFCAVAARPYRPESTAGARVRKPGTHDDRHRRPAPRPRRHHHDQPP